ncbi:unnamed protein product, partial [Musa acuminata var. zebrina]
MSWPFLTSPSVVFKRIIRRSLPVLFLGFHISASCWCLASFVVYFRFASHRLALRSATD